MRHHTALPNLTRQWRRTVPAPLANVERVQVSFPLAGLETGQVSRTTGSDWRVYVQTCGLRDSAKELLRWEQHDTGNLVLKLVRQCTSKLLCLWKEITWLDGLVHEWLPKKRTPLMRVKIQLFKIRQAGKKAFETFAPAYMLNPTERYLKRL